MARDSARPAGRRRAFTTQAADDRLPRVNLVYGDVRLDSADVRGRLAVQDGTSVDVNYSGERRRGAGHIQEATAGYRLAEGLWADGGIFLSHLGPESWISRDNHIYLRSLVAEFSPYYQSGVRLLYEPTPALETGLFILNGWQNVSDGRHPALGTTTSVRTGKAATLTLNTFAGEEGGGTRLFGDLIVRYAPEALPEVTAASDHGRQAGPGGASYWRGWTVTTAYRVSPNVRVNARVERFVDPDGIVTSDGEAPDPGTPGFRATGVSAGLDFFPDGPIRVRLEYRRLAGSGEPFPRSGGASDDAEVAVLSVSYDAAVPIG